MLLLGDRSSAAASQRVSGATVRETGAAGRGRRAKENLRMRLAYMALHLLPTLAVLAFVWLVVRAVSVRVVWRDTTVRNLDEPA